MKARKFIIISSILLVFVLISPKIYKTIEEGVYFKNHIVSYIAFADISITNKFTKGNEFFIELNIESEHYIKKYKIKDNTLRTYNLSSEKLYNQIHLDRNIDYAGITFKSVIDTRDMTQDEAEKFKEDPLLIISNQEYSKYIEVINISE